MNVFYLNTKDIYKEKSLRCDVDYRFLFSEKDFESYSFFDLFEFSSVEKPAIDKLYSDFLYNEIGNVNKEGETSPVLLNFSNKTLEDENYYKKIDNGDIMAVKKGDILLSKVRPNLKKFVRITERNENQFFTTAFIAIHPVKLPIISYYCLRNQFYNSLIAISRQGKGYPTINEKDLPYLRFDKKVIDILIKNEYSINIAILELEDKIESLKTTIKQTNEIINEIFLREFFNKNVSLDKLHKGMSYGTQNASNTELNIYSLSFSELGSNSQLRSSSRSHNPLFGSFELLLKNYGTIEIRSIATYIENGESPIYIKTGEIPVIKTANITIDGLCLDDIEHVGETQYINSEKAQIKNNDILICNIGKGSLGKTTINTLTDRMFAAAETMIIRVDNLKYNPSFLCYFLNSIFGVYQFEREYTGTTNQIHISPKIVEKFIIPDISLTEQQRIINEIQAEIYKQNEVKTQISILRSEIDNIIKRAISLYG